jgi:polyisoprenoid-binding protein YceI
VLYSIDMKNKIITSGVIVLVIVLIIGVYLLVQNQKIKAGLAGVEQSQVIEDSSNMGTNGVAVSSITLNRVNGAWSVDSTGMYSIDPSSLNFTFTGYKPGSEEVGTFNTMNAQISFDETGTPITSQITIDPKSVKTNSDLLNKHLQAPEFFDTTKYSDIKVVVKNIQKEGDSIKAITDITIKDVTKTLAVPVKVQIQDSGIQFSVDTQINIADFKMAYGPVQNMVRITLSGILKKR